MKPHILWGFIWIQIVCIGHQRSSKFPASGLRVNVGLTVKQTRFHVETIHIHVHQYKLGFCYCFAQLWPDISTNIYKYVLTNTYTHILGARLPYGVYTIYSKQSII